MSDNLLTQHHMFFNIFQSSVQLEAQPESTNTSIINIISKKKMNGSKKGIRLVDNTIIDYFNSIYEQLDRVHTRIEEDYIKRKFNHSRSSKIKNQLTMMKMIYIIII